MSIFLDSYETSTGSMVVIKDIENEIKKSIIKDGLDNVTLNVRHDGLFRPLFITGLLDSDVNIPLFTHPITIKNYNGKNYLCTDLRLFIKKEADIKNIEHGVKNLTEYNFAKSRAVINLIWLNEDINSFKNNFSFAGIVYANWLAETISKAFALDFKDQTTLAIITSYFYQTLFISKETEIDDEIKQRFAVHTIKATKAPAEFVFQVFDKINKRISNIEDFCEVVRDVLENVRLNKFNEVMLLTIIRNSWYGTNSKEIISVSLEHPPTWCAVIYTALTERTFKSSMIYRVAERFGKRGASDEFLKNYIDVVKGYTSVAS